MNPYVLLGIFATSTTIVVGIISLLVSLGVSLLTAFLGMYLFTIVTMWMMVRGAERVPNEGEIAEQGGYIEDQISSDVPANSQIEIVEAGVIKVVA